MSNSGRTMNFRISQRDLNRVLHLFDTSLDGLTETEANQRLSKSGPNKIDCEKPIVWYIQLIKRSTGILTCYCVLTQFFKTWFIKK